MEETGSKYRDYLQLCKDQEQIYHQVAVGLGLSDSVLSLLFTQKYTLEKSIFNEWSCQSGWLHIKSSVPFPLVPVLFLL